MIELQILNAKSQKVLRTFALDQEKELILGRGSDCDITINAKTVSREHLCIESDGEDFKATDLESTGGTFLYPNGKKVDEISIEDGLQLKIGPAILKFIKPEF